MEEVIVEIVGSIIIDGITYLVGKAVDGIVHIFIDEDNDGNPDYPELPDFEIPVESENDTSIIIVSPDGTMCIYDENGNIKAENCDLAYSLWISENGVMEKKLDNYSVTEGLLALILLFTVINFIRGLFTRKDYLR